MTVRVLESLDEAFGDGAEELIEAAQRRHLLDGVAIGAVHEGACVVRVMGRGIARSSRFELGSLTKTYTAELLSMLAARGTVRLDDPLAKYIGDGRAAQSRGDEAITLEDLATHSSGLERLPPGVPQLSSDPYADYRAERLEAFVARRGLRRPEKRSYLYSNLGFSLLGYALGKAAGVSYPELLRREILQPLGMTETELALGGPQPELVGGHRSSGLPAPHWTFDVCAPCGGLLSTVEDQVRWMKWLLDDPYRESFRPRADAPGGKIGLAWMLPAKGDLAWHNGATAGFSSWMSMDRRRGNGVTVLSNRQATGLVNDLGLRLQRCLNGGRAGVLKGDYGRWKGLLLDPLRIVLSPFSPVLSPLAALPLPVRIPVAVAAGYGLERLFELISAAGGGR